ncbi:uncharacterized protein LOC117301105 [Asterias rubens]|uniref:uncharacterized protein LOC117301105 n=1 Tax=Asterias rubens TaxID=7604 RepID=UPI001455497D|nr:uncharacterized protein LOC117301105 [Asterias rubens]
MVPYRLLNTEGVKTTAPDMFLGVLLSMESKVQRVSNRLLGNLEARLADTLETLCHQLKDCNKSTRMTLHCIFNCAPAAEGLHQVYPDDSSLHFQVNLGISMLNQLNAPTAEGLHQVYLDDSLLQVQGVQALWSKSLMDVNVNRLCTNS